MNINFNHLTLGVCYYPEHWDESIWQDDLRRMKEHGIEVIRIAEFAWNKFEIKEGEYTFEFFDKFMDLTLSENIKVIFCTPTATPPAWMTEKYPEILNADIDGNLLHHGMRCHYNFTSPVYLDFSAKITEKLAAHYSKYPNIIGWQLDNELNCAINLYYSESDHKAFREYMKNKFKTLDNLNNEMGTVFWNQTYTNWNEVYLSRRTTVAGETNPHMQLEEKRFISDSSISFLKLQADIIRKYAKKDVFITTNGLFGHLDYKKLTDECLDFMTYDNYPNFAYDLNIEPEKTNGLRDRNSSFNLSRIRSFSNTFGIMEQQSGGGGWNCRMLQPMPKPGQMRLWTLQAIAHGADFISYFRWRTCAFGTEMYWHGLNDPSNKPNRRLFELKEINKDIKKLNEIAKSKYKANVAILKDYDNEWDGENDIWHGDFRKISEDAWFCCLQKQHIPFDFLYIDDNTKLSDLSKYDFVIYPHAAILSDNRADVLKQYAKQGGQLIFGCQTSYKEINGQHTTDVLPSKLSELCGIEINEYTMLSKYDDTEYIVVNDKKVSAPLFNDILHILDAEVAGVFQNNYYDGKPAISKKRTGKGCTYYVGSVFNEDTALLLCDIANIKSHCNDLFDLSEEVEFAVREKDGIQYIFILNYEANPVEITLKEKLYEMINEKEIVGKYTINRYDCLIFKKNKLI